VEVLAEAPEIGNWALSLDLSEIVWLSEAVGQVEIVELTELESAEAADQIGTADQVEAADRTGWSDHVEEGVSEESPEGA
jgi:hypothetical protein